MERQEQGPPLAEIGIQATQQLPFTTMNQGYSIDATDWNGILQRIAQARSSQELHAAVLELHQAMQQTANLDGDSLPHDADRPLVWQLATTCLQLQQHQADDRPSLLTPILRIILQCLLRVWSNSSRSPKGGVDALPWLLTAWKVSLGDATVVNHQQSTVIIATTVRSLSLLAKQQLEVKHSMIQQQAAMLVPMIVQTAQIPNTNNANEVGEEKKSEEALQHNDSPQELTGVLFQLIQELTLRAAAKDQVHMYEQLLDTVLERGCVHDSSVAQAATAILWNWAVSLPGRMSKNPAVWTKVQSLWKEHQLEPVKRNLSAIIGTMIAACTVEKVDQEAVGRIQEQAWLIPSLLKALQVDTSTTQNDTDYRRRCMRTIRCLAVSEWGRTFLWQHADGQFGMVLVQVLRSDVADDIDTRILACQTLAFILPTLQEVQLGPCLETTLIQVIEDADENVDFTAVDKLVLAASQALTVSLQCSPWKRGAGCFSTALFDQILAVLQEQVDQPAYHAGFSELFVQLVAVEGDDNVETRIKGISTLLVSYPAVLEIMAVLLSPLAAGPDFDASRSNAVKVLTAIVNDDDRNKKPMADDENVLTALVNVCLMTNNEGPLKDDAKQLILTLVPEL